MVEFNKSLGLAELLSTMPDIERMLENSGGFWPRIKDNTIPNSELLREIAMGAEHQAKNAQNYLGYDDPQDLEGFHISATLTVSLLILSWRKAGILPTPIEPIKTEEN